MKEGSWITLDADSYGRSYRPSFLHLAGNEAGGAQAPLTTAKEAAAMAGCSVETVRRAVRSGDLEGLQ